MCYPLTESRVTGGEALSLQQWDSAAGRVDMRGYAQRTDTEGAGLPGRANGRSDAHQSGRVHANGDEKVLSRVLAESRASGILENQRVYVERPRHDRFCLRVMLMVSVIPH